MNKSKLTPKYKELLIQIIKKHLPNTKIYLFGSRARGTNTPGADIDISVDAGEKINIRTISKIKYNIEETSIPFFVDVIDLNNIEKEIKEEILKDGILWND